MTKDRIGAIFLKSDLGEIFSKIAQKMGLFSYPHYNQYYVI